MTDRSTDAALLSRIEDAVNSANPNDLRQVFSDARQDPALRVTLLEMGLWSLDCSDPYLRFRATSYADQLQDGTASDLAAHVRACPACRPDLQTFLPNPGVERLDRILAKLTRSHSAAALATGGALLLMLAAIAYSWWTIQRHGAAADRALADSTKAQERAARGAESANLAGERAEEAKEAAARTLDLYEKALRETPAGYSDMQRKLEQIEETSQSSQRELARLRARCDALEAKLTPALEVLATLDQESTQLTVWASEALFKIRGSDVSSSDMLEIGEQWNHWRKIIGAWIETGIEAGIERAPNWQTLVSACDELQTERLSFSLAMRELPPHYRLTFGQVPDDVMQDVDRTRDLLDRAGRVGSGLKRAIEAVRRR